MRLMYHGSAVSEKGAQVMTYDDWKCSEPVAYDDEAPRVLCAECGADLEDDGHARWCIRSDDYFEPGGNLDGWDDGGTGGIE